MVFLDLLLKTNHVSRYYPELLLQRGLGRNMGQSEAQSKEDCPTRRGVLAAGLRRPVLTDSARSEGHGEARTGKLVWISQGASRDRTRK